jgi:hypothetical protein
MEETETPCMNKYRETTNNPIMMAAVSDIASGVGLINFLVT